MKKYIFFGAVLLVGLGVLASQGWQWYQLRRIASEEHLGGQDAFDEYLKAQESGAVPLFSFQAEFLRIEGDAVYIRVAETAGDGNYVNYVEDALELGPDTSFYVLSPDSDVPGQPSLTGIQREDLKSGDKVIINLRADNERTESKVYSIYVLE